VDPVGIDPAEELVEQLDIDSMDFLNLIVAVHERTGIEIPERDYAKRRPMPTTGTSGKAARLVLRRQLEVARRGADLLSRKRQAPLADQRRLREEAAATAGEWTDAVNEAERWLARASLLDGASEMARIALCGERSPELTVVWESLMGVVRPRIAGLEQGSAPPVSSLGGSSALHYAVLAYRRATRAAARQAAAQIALERVSHELTAVARRPSRTRDRAALDPTARDRPGHA
jgi:V/A-type H+-transporting ATPase subunit D